MEQKTAREVQDAVNEALAFENKLVRMRSIQRLGRYAFDSYTRQLTGCWVEVSQEIIRDVKNLNGLHSCRLIYFNKDAGIVSSKRVRLKEFAQEFDTNADPNDNLIRSSRINLEDHGYRFCDKNGHAVILSAPYGSTTEILETFKEIVGDYPVEIEFSPGDGHANHHSPGFARGIAIRSAKAKPMIWPDYYYKYPGSIR